MEEKVNGKDQRNGQEDEASEESPIRAIVEENFSDDIEEPAYLAVFAILRAPKMAVTVR